MMFYDFQGHVVKGLRLPPYSPSAWAQGPPGHVQRQLPRPPRWEEAQDVEKEPCVKLCLAASTPGPGDSQRTAGPACADSRRGLYCRTTEALPAQASSPLLSQTCRDPNEPVLRWPTDPRNW